jgi:hypothetical protein
VGVVGVWARATVLSASAADRQTAAKMRIPRAGP